MHINSLSKHPQSKPSKSPGRQVMQEPAVISDRRLDYVWLRSLKSDTTTKESRQKEAPTCLVPLRDKGNGLGERAPNRKMPLVGQRRPALPRTDSAVPSALGGLTSGFGMGPGVPPLPWSLTNKGHSALGVRPRRALRAAQRDVGPLAGPLG